MKYFLTIIFFYTLSSSFAQDKWLFHSYGINYNDTLSDLQSATLFPKYLKSNDSLFYSVDCLDSCDKYVVIAPVIKISDSVIYVYIQQSSRSSSIIGAFYNKVISTSKDSLDIEIIYSDDLYKTINLSLKEIGFTTNPQVIDITYLGNNIVELTSLISYQETPQNNHTRLEYHGICHIENNKLAITIIPRVIGYTISGSSPKAIVYNFYEQELFKKKIYLAKEHFCLTSNCH
ncbi:hypothetical protein ACE193_06835 [Bernardetia sp. OM2101]|uniref:hypothetical protein n=1 Tax=Bernardetia sp. OM2101 TaxID=3344876 RepID=UPI0035D070BB